MLSDTHTGYMNTFVNLHVLIFVIFQNSGFHWLILTLFTWIFIPMLYVYVSLKIPILCCLILTLVTWIYLWTLVCWSLWLFKILGSIDWYSHYLHEYLFQCFMCMWVLRYPFLVVWYSHWLHEYICEPSCVDLCVNIYPNVLCVLFLPLGFWD